MVIQDQPKLNEIWLVRLPYKTTLNKATISYLTELAVKLDYHSGGYAEYGYFKLDDVEFIEKFKEVI